MWKFIVDVLHHLEAHPAVGDEGFLHVSNVVLLSIQLAFPHSDETQAD